MFVLDNKVIGLCYYYNILALQSGTDSKFSLEDYLNQELLLNDNLLDNVLVKYFDSSQNCFIQIADVFSNIMYSNLITKGAYKKELELLQQNKYILPSFIFPQKKFKNSIKKI